MWNNIKYKLAQFMTGRYGADRFGQFLSGLILVLLIIELFTGWGLLWWICLVLLIYMYYRMLSRNVAKRYEENRKFMDLSWKVRQTGIGKTVGGFFRKIGDWFRNLFWKSKQSSEQRRRNEGYHIYKCPQCGQKIRIPKGKGKIMIRCPKCGNEFQKRS